MKHIKINAAILTVLGLLVSPVLLAADWLITPEELAADQVTHGSSIGALSMPLPVSGAPEIRLVKPEDAVRTRSPLDIQLVFKAQDNAGIEPDSFRVLYGFFQKDITSRILKYGVLTEQGVLARHVEIPPGEYRLLVQVADKHQRMGETVINLKVE